MPCAKKMRGCKASCGHKALIQAFYLEQHHYDQKVDDLMWATERAEWMAGNPQPTLKAWLIGHKKPEAPAEEEHAA